MHGLVHCTSAVLQRFSLRAAFGARPRCLAPPPYPFSGPAAAPSTGCWLPTNLWAPNMKGPAAQLALIIPLPLLQPAEPGAGRKQNSRPANVGGRCRGGAARGGQPAVCSHAGGGLPGGSLCHGGGKGAQQRMLHFCSFEWGGAVHSGGGVPGVGYARVRRWLVRVGAGCLSRRMGGRLVHVLARSIGLGASCTGARKRCPLPDSPVPSAGVVQRAGHAAAGGLCAGGGSAGPGVGPAQRAGPRVSGRDVCVCVWGGELLPGLHHSTRYCFTSAAVVFVPRKGLQAQGVSGRVACCLPAGLACLRAALLC